MLKNTILYELHSSPLGGHAEFTRTLARVTSQFYWKGLWHDVKAYVQQCLTC